MNALWNMITHYLPSVRIHNDLEDGLLSDYDGSETYELPTHSRDARALARPTAPLPLTDIVVPDSDGRMVIQSQTRKSVEHRRESWYHVAQVQANKEKELEAEQLRTQVQSLQRQLMDLRSDLSSTKGALEFQRRSVTHLLSETNTLQSHLSQSEQAYRSQSAELEQLRSSYADLSSSAHTGTNSGVDSTAISAELASLKSFLNRIDDYTGSQILQAVQDLNTEIVQFAAAVSEEYPLGQGGGGTGGGELWRESDREIVRRAMGEGMCDLVKDGDHEQDPTVVQLAIQAWEVWCCRQVFEAFCWGIPPQVDQFLNEVFREMQITEPQAMTSRWRALTHMHARTTLLNPPLSLAIPHHATAYANGFSTTESICPSIPPSPLASFPAPTAYPTPYSTTNNTPAMLPPPLPHQISPSSSSQSYSLGSPQRVPLPHQLRIRLSQSSSGDPSPLTSTSDKAPRPFASPMTPSNSQGSNSSAPGFSVPSVAAPTMMTSSRSQHINSNLRGILALLALAGCTDERGIHRDPLRERWAEQVERLLERAEGLARIIREGVGSAWFEVSVESGPPLMKAGESNLSGGGTRTKGVRKNSSAGKINGVNGVNAVHGSTLNGNSKGKERGVEDDREPWRRMFDPTDMDNVYAGYGDENSRVLCTVEFGLTVVKKRNPMSSSSPEEVTGAGLHGTHGGKDGNGETAKSVEKRKEVLDMTMLLKPKVLLESVKDLL